MQVDHTDLPLQFARVTCLSGQGYSSWLLSLSYPPTSLGPLSPCGYKGNGSAEIDFHTVDLESAQNINI